MSPFQGRWRLFTDHEFYGILNTIDFDPISIANVASLQEALRGHLAEAWGEAL